jgi:hypothetical protein
MQGRKFTVMFHFHGTLAADMQGRFVMPCQATLIEVSAGASNDAGTTITVGTSADADGYCQSQEIGDSGTPIALTQNGALISASGRTHVPNDTVVLWAADFNGAGDAGENVSILFTFEE